MLELGWKDCTGLSLSVCGLTDLSTTITKHNAPLDIQRRVVCLAIWKIVLLRLATSVGQGVAVFR